MWRVGMSRFLSRKITWLVSIIFVECHVIPFGKIIRKKWKMEICVEIILFHWSSFQLSLYFLSRINKVWLIKQNISSMREILFILVSVISKTVLGTIVFVEYMNAQNSIHIKYSSGRVSFESLKITYQKLLQLVLLRIYIKPIMDFKLRLIYC